MWENLWLLVAKMDASFHFMRWSLVQECLATADFSSSAFSQLVLCSLRRNERFRPVSPTYTKPHSRGIRYTPDFWNSLTLSLCVQRDRNNLFRSLCLAKCLFYEMLLWKRLPQNASLSIFWQALEPLKKIFVPKKTNFEFNVLFQKWNLRYSLPHIRQFLMSLKSETIWVPSKGVNWDTWCELGQNLVNRHRCNCR